MSSTPLSRPTSSLIPTLTTLPELRSWRSQAFQQGRSVGVVPTMGALHEGHLNLVKHSLAQNPSTILTHFINPTQFAPHEDLSSYPRTLARDLELLEGVLTTFRRSGSGSGSGEAQAQRQGDENQLVVFNPGRETMYPLSEMKLKSDVDSGVGMLQDVNKQRGAFVEVKGWGDVLEGASRPQFFRGVATVCTKLFNAVQPDHAYFGQKDIQQALLLKIMLKDLLNAYPTSENLHIIPTTRDPLDNLALSSRNAYLTPSERPFAPTLHRALSIVKNALVWPEGNTTAEEAVESAKGLVLVAAEEARKKGVEVRFDYISVFDRHTFEEIRGELGGREGVVAGAIWVGKTRLIDNLLLGWEV